MNRLGFLVGLAFGWLLAAARMNDYDVVHNMLLLREPDLYLVMGSAVAVAAPVLWLLARRRWRTPLGGALELDRVPAERKHILGSAVFGTGWALTGACPGTALAMPAAGTLLGLPVIGGLFAGTLLRDAVAARPAAGRLPAPASRRAAASGEAPPAPARA